MVCAKCQQGVSTYVRDFDAAKKEEAHRQEIERKLELVSERTRRAYFRWLEKGEDEEAEEELDKEASANKKDDSQEDNQDYTEEDKNNGDNEEGEKDTNDDNTNDDNIDDDNGKDHPNITQGSPYESYDESTSDDEVHSPTNDHSHSEVSAVNNEIQGADHTTTKSVAQQKNESSSSINTEVTGIHVPKPVTTTTTANITTKTATTTATITGIPRTAETTTTTSTTAITATTVITATTATTAIAATVTTVITATTTTATTTSLKRPQVEWTVEPFKFGTSSKKS